jgi:glycosyltransferase involved in cell wall biosynthesis
MKILYVAPYPPLKSGVAYYAYNFKNEIEHCLNIQIDLLDICQNENIYSMNKFVSLSKQISSLKTITKYNIIHFEIGGAQNREFYILYFIKKCYPLIKTVVTLHDPPIILSAPMKFIGFESMPRIFRGIRKIGDLTIGRYWEKKILGMVDQIIILTEKRTQQMSKRFRKDILYFPLLNFDKNIETKKYRDKVVKILFFGYLGDKKGIDILIKSFAQLLKSSPINDDIRLYICGGLSEGVKMIKFQDYLQKLLVDLDVSENVVFTGSISEQERIFYLKDADIMVLPYREQNNFSSSGPLIQGMSHGLPIIASDVKNFSNDIEDGKTGILFEDGNVKMLAEKIKLLIDNKSLRKKLGENAQNHIFKEHSPQYISDRIFQIYKTCLEKK